MSIGPVKDSLCFKLHLATRMMTSLYKPLLAALNLTFPQFLVMGLLWEKDQQTIKSLGHQLHLDSGTLTPIVKRLELACLVIRKKSLKDERSNFIHLTSKGHSLKSIGIEAGEKFYQNLKLETHDMETIKTILDDWLEKQFFKDE